MKISKLVPVLESYYVSANMELPILLIGESGVGKTQSVKDFAKKIGYDLEMFHFGQMADSGDITGVPFVSDEGGVKVTRFARPVSLVKSKNKKVLFLDEINRAEKDLLQAGFPMILSKVTGGEPLPEGTIIIAAANPPTDNYTVLDFSDIAWTSRFCQIKVETDMTAFMSYAAPKYPKSDYLNFIQEHPQYFISSKMKKAPWSINDYVNKTEGRSDEFVCKLEQSPFMKDVGEDSFEEVLTGIIGLEAAISYTKFLKNKKQIFYSANDVFSKKFQDKLVNKMSPDSIAKTLDDIYITLFKKTNEVLDIKNAAGNLMDFLDILNKDLSVGFSKRCLDSDSLKEIGIDKIEDGLKVLEDVKLCTGSVSRFSKLYTYYADLNIEKWKKENPGIEVSE